MMLYIMRHGPAVERGTPDYPDDALRPLTAAGRKKTRSAARGLVALKTGISVVLTSPLARARQTADIAAAELSIPTTAVRETVALEPGAAPPDLFTELSKLDSAAAVLLVGHEPDLSELVSQLVTGDRRALNAPLKKAGIAMVDVGSMPPADRGVLCSLLTPRQLRKLDDQRG